MCKASLVKRSKIIVKESTPPWSQVGNSLRQLNKSTLLRSVSGCRALYYTHNGGSLQPKVHYSNFVVCIGDSTGMVLMVVQVVLILIHLVTREFQTEETFRYTLACLTKVHSSTLIMKLRDN